MYGNGTELHQEVFGPESSDTVNYSTMKHPKTQSGVLESRNVLFLVLDASGISSTCHAHVAQRILTLYSLRICKRFPVQYTDIPYFPIKSLTWGSASSHASRLFVVFSHSPLDEVSTLPHCVHCFHPVFTNALLALWLSHTIFVYTKPADSMQNFPCLLHTSSSVYHNYLAGTRAQILPVFSAKSSVSINEH